MEIFRFCGSDIYHDHSIYDCDADDRTMAIVQTYERDQKRFDIHRYVWVLAIVLFFVYLDASYIYLDDSALFKLRIYMYMVIFIGIIGIWMFLDIEAAAWDTETAKHKTELKRAGRTVAAGKK